jgi:hydrogenase maturation factor HypF (carbamoyltransferase family)
MKQDKYPIYHLNLANIKKLPASGVCTECNNSDIEIIPRLDEDTNEIVPDYAICMNCNTEYDIDSPEPSTSKSPAHESHNESPF